MNTKQLEYIVSIDDEKSLTKAAEHFNLSQSAFSQHLFKLKLEGLPPIFKKANNTLVLTEAGKIYVFGARHILSLWQECQEELEALKKTR